MASRVCSVPPGGTPSRRAKPCSFKRCGPSLEQGLIIRCPPSTHSPAPSLVGDVEIAANRDPRSADSTRARNTLPTGLVRTGQLLAEIAPYDGSNLSSSAHLGEMRTHPAPISVATARRWRNRASRAAAAFGNAFTILGQAGASTSRRHARVLLARSRRWLAHRQAIDVNPVREIFERPFPAIDAETMFDVYHPRAKRTLRAAMIPQSIQSIHFAWRLEPRKR
jgi:hypothetical protein